MASSLDFGIVEIEAEALNPGILAQATALIAKENISIRQAHAGDPELEEKTTSYHNYRKAYTR